MTAMDMKLIKMLNDHYWLKSDKVVNKISFKGRTFYNKFEKVKHSIPMLSLDKVYNINELKSWFYKIINDFTDVKILYGGSKNEYNDLNKNIKFDNKIFLTLQVNYH